MAAVGSSWSDVLERRGLSRVEAAACGARRDAEGRLLIPVRDEHGIERATRCYAGPEAGAPAMDDLGLLEAPLRGTVGLWQGRRFDSTPHVARPTPDNRAPQRHDQAVFLVDDEIAAEIVVRRLGAIAVAPASESMIEEAAALAARLSDRRRVVVALRRSPARAIDADEGRCFSRATLSVEAAGGEPVLLVLATGESIETLICEGRQLRTMPLDADRVQLSRQGGILGLAGAGLAAVVALWRAIFAAWSSRRARAAAVRLRGVPAARFDPPAEPYLRMLGDIALIVGIARSRDVELVAIGGLAVDLLCGTPTRARDDLDLFMLGGSLADVDALADALESVGYAYVVRIPGRLSRLRRGASELVEIFCPRLTPSGWLLEMPSFRVAFPTDLADAERRSLGPLDVRTLRIELLLAWKELQLREIESVFLRSEIERSRRLRLDVAVLRTLVGIDLDPIGPWRRGVMNCQHPGTDVVSATLGQLRSVGRRLLSLTW